MVIAEVRGVHRGSEVFTEGLMWSQRVRGCHGGLCWSHMVCCVDKGSVVSAWGLWVSQRCCGVHRVSAVFTEGL